MRREAGRRARRGEMSRFLQFKARILSAFVASSCLKMRHLVDDADAD